MGNRRLNKIGVGDVRISEAAKANVNKALDDNRLSYGPFSREFERRFAELHGKRFACFVNSGTSALQIGLAAMKEHCGWEDGSEVLVPALTFVASVNVIIQNNLTPRFVDVDSYYGMNLSHVASIVGRYEAGDMPQPVAVMPVHLFGQTASPDLRKFCNLLGIKTIADSCETMGVAGCADGEVSCFSTFACHLINTGVGGLALTDDPELARLIRSLANHGRNGIYTSIDDAMGVRETMDARFQFDRLGYSYRATELEAAIGCAELDVWPENKKARQRNAAYLHTKLAGLPLELPKVRPGHESAWMMFPILAGSRTERDALEAHLENKGIETRRMLPLTNQPYFKERFGDIERNFPMSHRVNETGFYVGVHQYLTQPDLDRMARAFRDFFRA